MRWRTLLAAVTDMTLDVWHWNIAGHTTHEGKTNTGVLEHDFNVQPHFAHLDRYCAPSLNEVANRDNTGAHRELDDTDTRCPGYGEFTASVRPESTPPCGGLSEIDLIMARESQIVGSYTGDSLLVPEDCVVTGTNEEACSDHRVTIGRVTVRVVAP